MQHPFAGHAECLKVLLEAGCDLGDWRSQGRHRLHGYRASHLHLAVDLGRLECARILLQHDADTETHDPDGRTPLVSAAFSSE